RVEAGFLDRYLRRVGLESPPPATRAGLAALHRAHAGTIPFENLDILLGRPIRLDLASIAAKLVPARRGGSRLVHHAPFAAAREAMGFAVTRLAARVRLGGRKDGPRTPMLLSVRAEGRDWLSDVGFGGGGLWEPLALEPGGEVAQGGWRFRLVAEGDAR